MDQKSFIFKAILAIRDSDSYLGSPNSWCSANLFPQLPWGSICGGNLLDRSNLWCSTVMFHVCYQSEEQT